MKGFGDRGGAGFVGSNLTEALLIRGHWVRVLDNFSTGKKENLAFDPSTRSLEIIDGDIRDVTLCQKAMKEIEVVLHHAALPSVERSVEDLGEEMSGTLWQISVKENNI